MSAALDYFALSEPRAVLSAKGGGLERVKQPIYFIGVLLGAIALTVFNRVSEGAAWDWKSLVIALIVSILTFPYAYEHAGLSLSKMTLAKWCIAFQYGFFWPALLEKVKAAVG